MLKVQDRQHGAQNRWSKTSVTAAVLILLNILQALGLIDPSADIEAIIAELELAIVGLIAIFMRQAVNEVV